MTQNTERADFEAWWSSPSVWSHGHKEAQWSAWQAARRAPAAQVPQGWSLREAAQDALAWLDEDDLNMTHNIRERLRSALAAAPQPPEAAQLPEPWGACVSDRIFVGKLPEHARSLAEAENLPIQLLYTAPQVHQLLAVGLKPLTDEEIAEGMATCDVAPGDAELGTFTEGVRFAERVRGITGEPT